MDGQETVVDILAGVAVELRCNNCGGTYQISLRQMLLSRDALHEGCVARSATECYPDAYASLVARGLIEQFQEAWLRLEEAAQGFGGTIRVADQRN